MWIPAPLRSSEQLLPLASEDGGKKTRSLGSHSQHGSGEKVSLLLELTGKHAAVGTESPSAKTPLSYSESAQLYLQKRLETLLSPGSFVRMDSKSNSETLRKAIKWDRKHVLILPLVHTGMDGCDNTFQNLEWVPWPNEVSTASTAKGERGDWLRRGPASDTSMAPTLRWTRLDAGSTHCQLTAIRGMCCKWTEIYTTC